ncbi:alkaline phosphatase D family protein [Acinetobacter seifertii]|nr:alkaline phosphatase D family protein [Acinetobacter seifertii]
MNGCRFVQFLVDHLNIYRQFNFGSLVQLTMLDTRIIARDKQLEYADYMTALA